MHESVKDMMARCFACKVAWSHCNPEVCFGKWETCAGCGHIFRTVSKDMICDTCWDDVKAMAQEEIEYTPEENEE
jgi:hypothetical protein